MKRSLLKIGLSLVLAGLLATGTLLAYRPAMRHLASGWAKEVPLLDETEAAVQIGRIYRLGNEASPALVPLLGSRRETIAAAAKQSLMKSLKEANRLESATTREYYYTRLAESLAMESARFDPSSHPHAIELAQAILQSHLDPAWKNTTRILVACEQILELELEPELDERKNRTQSASNRPNDSREIANAAYPAKSENPRQPSRDSWKANSPSGHSLFDLTKIPGGNLSTPSLVEPKRTISRDKHAPQASAPAETAPPRLTTGLNCKQSIPCPAPTPSSKNRLVKQDPNQPGGQSIDALPEFPFAQPAEPTVARTSNLLPPSIQATLELMRLLQNADPNEAARARAELKQKGFREIHFALARNLFDPDPQARIELARAVPRLTSVDPQPWLFSLTVDPDPTVRRTALGLLATSGNPAIVQTAGQIARADEDPEVRALGTTMDGPTPPHASQSPRVWR